MTPEELGERYLANEPLTPEEREIWWRWRHREMTRAQARRKGGPK